MKILHISKYYYPYIGGVENICRYLVEEMGEGYETSVVCFGEGRKDEVDEVDGHRVYRVGTWMNVARQALSPTYFRMLRRALREEEPDMIHFHWANPFAAWVLMSMMPERAKLAVYWHMDIVGRKAIYRVIKPVETALLRRADVVTVTSPQYMEASEPLQAFRDKVRVVANAINTGPLEMREGDERGIEEVRKRYGGRKIVFFVGRHIKYKGLPWLIEAERHVKEECEIVIAGKGPLTEELKRQCTSVRVHFVGRLSDDELRWHLHAASVFAFPSVTKNEAFGVALAEAMYCGKPAVTFHIEGSGVNWVCPDGEAGLEAPNGDAMALARNIDRLLGDDGLAKRMGEAGRRRVTERFTVPTMVGRMREIYDSLCL